MIKSQKKNPLFRLKLHSSIINCFVALRKFWNKIFSGYDCPSESLYSLETIGDQQKLISNAITAEIPTEVRILIITPQALHEAMSVRSKGLLSSDPTVYGLLLQCCHLLLYFTSKGLCSCYSAASE